MVLTSTGVIAVQQAPKMAAPIISIPWRGPSCLLPLSEALQHCPVGLPQAPFKQLPLAWTQSM